MQIKKFIAPTLKEATIQMKDELGGEAIILGTRLLEGDAGFGKRRLFEITAGTEEEMPFIENYETSAENLLDKRTFQSELNEMSKRFSSPASGLNVVSTEHPVVDQANKHSTEKRIKEIMEDLYNKDVQKKVISAVVAELKKYKKFLHTSNLNNYVLSALSSLITVHNLEFKKTGQPKVISFVGPTGVGKTTCIAKLAIITKILHNLDVGLISIDTYRLGAIDQLKIFAEISQTDMLVAYEPEEIKKHMQKFRKKDIVFIDTAGRSPRNAAQLLKTKNFLDVISSNETFLVLSAASTTKSMIDAAEKFDIFQYSSFIFTKIDEAVTYGNILNVLSETRKPAAFLSNGQTIPDDILTADPEFISNMILNGTYQHVRTS